MFIPHARVHIAGIAYWKGSKAKGGQSRRRLGMREILRMPCLMPTAGVVLIGLFILAGGAGMSVLGYIPDTVTTVSDGSNTTTVTMVTRDARYYATKSLSYAGPVLMGCGFFAIIVSCVLYCEIVDRYTVIMPRKPEAKVKRRDLMDMILSEFKKSYFRGIEVPLRKMEPPAQQKGEREKETLLKALSISTPVLLMSPDLAPTWRFSHHAFQYPGRRHMKPRHPKLKQLGGSSGSSGHEPWLKTSSLPNICDPDIRRHDLPRPVPLDTHEVTKVRRLKRFGRPCRSMDNRISWSLPHTLSRSTTGVDNPAYLHEQDRKKSLSMCVHPEASALAAVQRPQARFVKASQMQPRVRLLQQHQQQIQKQQQQQQQLPQNQQHQPQKQQQHQSKPKNAQTQRSQDSTESMERRRCDSDQSRPRQRPKLVRTKAAHASFDVSDAQFASMEPPPFPLPAHYIAKKPSDGLSVLSPRTAKLLKARAKSEEAKDKKKPEMILLKDLFRSFDIHDDALLSVSPMATTSSAPGSTAAMVYLDPLAGQKCEVVRHASWDQQAQQERAAAHAVKNDNCAVATPGSSGVAASGAFKRAGDRASSESPVPAPAPGVRTDADDQCYQLPLLSGVLRSHSQCDVKQRTNIIRCSRETEKSLSLDTKDRVPGLEVKRQEVQRAHSFNTADIDPDFKAQLVAGGQASRKPHTDKGSSHKLRVFGAPSHKARPKSWDGDKSHSLDTADLEKGTCSTLTVPRLDRANSFEPLGGGLGKQCSLLSQGLAFEDHVHPSSFRVDDETRTGKSGSEEIRQKTPIPTVTLTVPLPSVFIQPPVENHKPDKSQAGRKQHRLKKQHTVVPNPLYHQHKETKEKQCASGSDRSQKSVQRPTHLSSPCEGDASQKPSAGQGQTQAKKQHVQHVPQKQQQQQEQSASLVIHRAAVHLPADCAPEKRTMGAAGEGRGPSTTPAVVPHLPPPPPSPSTPLFTTSLLLPSTSCAVFSPLPPPSPTSRILLPSPASSASSPVSPSPTAVLVALPPPSLSPSSVPSSRLTPTSMLLSKASALLQPASCPASSRPSSPSPAAASTTTTTTPPSAGTPTTLSTSLSVDAGVSAVHGAGSRRPVSPLAMRNRLRTRSVAVEESSMEEEYTENTPLIQTPGVHSSSTCSTKPQ